MNARFDIAQIARIAEQLEVLCEDDERLFADMMVGETDLDVIVSRLHGQLASDGELLTGIAARQEELATRKRRLSDRTVAVKAAIGKVLRAAHLTKLELPEATFSVRDGKPSLKVVDPNAVPEELCRIKSEPDKPKINEAFADVEKLPNWLVRDPALDVVTVRTK